MTKHKACPFCGGKAEIIGIDAYWIRCPECRVALAIHNTAKAAWAAWDKRVKEGKRG